MLHTGDIKVVDTIVTIKVKGKAHTVEIHPDQWDTHKEEIKALVQGEVVEIKDEGGVEGLYNPSLVASSCVPY